MFARNEEDRGRTHATLDQALRQTDIGNCVYMEEEHTLRLEIPLETATQAYSLCESLKPDPSLGSNAAREFRVEGTKLIVDMKETSVKSLRVGANSFMDTLREALECLVTFDPAYYTT